MSATCDTIAQRKDAQLTDADFDVLGDILQCTICYSEYSDSPGALPRSLPCGHTFCTSCLETFYRSVPDCDSLAIECPTCRKRHYMPLPSGIDVVASPVAASFPINFCVKEVEFSVTTLPFECTDSVADVWPNQDGNIGSCQIQEGARCHRA
jgi:hypothetical protein